MIQCQQQLRGLIALSLSLVSLSVNVSAWANIKPGLGSIDIGGEEEGVQLVQSVPVGTELAVPSLPSTANTWLEMIKNAKKTLDSAQFYISAQPASAPDKSKALEPLLEALESAGKRGVKTRFLFAASMKAEDPRTLERLQKMKGVTVRFYDLTSLTGGVHHAKYWIRDGKEVFLGSPNLDWRSVNQIHELGVKVNSADLGRQLTRVFDLDWKVAKTRQLPPANLTEYFSPFPMGPRKIELVASPSMLNPPEIRSAIQALTELLRNAKKSIQVQLMDYSPVSGSQIYWSEIDDELRSAALRGVKIQLLVSNGATTQKSMDYLKSLAVLPGVEIKVIAIPQLESGPIPYGRLIRSKYMTIDDEIFWIGNSNWGKGYFYNSRNVELILRRPEVAAAGKQVFEKLWNSNYGIKILRN